jgi:hypothetical protein
LIRVKVEIFEKVKQTRSKISEEDDVGTVSPATFKQFALYQLESLHKIYELDTNGLDSDITSEAFGKLLKML